MSCWDTVADYALRSVGIGERLLPRADFTICQQVTLIGSGMIWNIYFGTLALLSGFFLATALAMAKAAHSPLLRKPAEWFIFVFRGSPLFIQSLEKALFALESFGEAEQLLSLTEISKISGLDKLAAQRMPQVVSLQIGRERIEALAAQT